MPPIPPTPPAPGTTRGPAGAAPAARRGAARPAIARAARTAAGAATRLTGLTGRVAGRALPAAAPAAVIALAAWVRLAGLGSPATHLVDEPYYVGGARSLLERGYEATYRLPIAGEVPAVHPPLGKWLIALGMLALGDRAPGWRIAAAVAGIATVALVYLCARRLFPGRGAALAAATLLAVEDLSVVQSRTAMLDAFLAFWLVAAVYALLRERDQADAQTREATGETASETAPPAAPGPARASPPGRRPWRPWRLAAGALLGCALATKWSAAFALPVMACLALAWALRRRREPGVAGALDALRAEAPGVAGALVFLPLAVYLLSYAGLFASGTSTIAGWWVDQVQALQFHATLGATHPYASTPPSWLITRRPMVYFYNDAPGPGGIREILALGHPLVFLAIVPTAVWAAVRWWRAGDGAIAVPLLLALAMWLPWVPQSRPMFIYYMTPVIPFVALLQGAALARLARAHPRAGPAIAGAALAAALALLWFHWPVLTGAPLGEHAWALRVANWGRIPLLRFDWV